MNKRQVRYLALFGNTGQEIQGHGYSRQPVQLSEAHTVEPGGITAARFTNSEAVEFPVASDGGYYVAEVRMCDAAEGDVAYPLSSIQRAPVMRDVPDGGRIIFHAASIKIFLPPGVGE